MKNKNQYFFPLFCRVRASVRSLCTLSRGSPDLSATRDVGACIEGATYSPKEEIHLPQRLLVFRTGEIRQQRQHHQRCRDASIRRPVPPADGLEISIARLDLAPKGVIPLHVHPNGYEVLVVVEGRSWLDSSARPTAYTTRR